MFCHMIISLVYVLGQILEVQLLSSYLSVELQHILGFVFKVRGSIEAFWDEQAIRFSSGHWHISLRNSDELLLDLTAKI